MKTGIDVVEKNKLTVLILVIIIAFIVSIITVLFFSPVDREFRRLQNNTVFQSFEKQFPDVQKQKIGFDRYAIEYHAQSKDSQIVLAKNSSGTVYFACDGNHLDSEPVIEISPEEFKSLIQQEIICTPDVYQAWEIK